MESMESPDVTAAPVRFAPQRRPYLPPPPPERDERHVAHYRDAVYAQVLGFRALVLDLAVPRKNTARPFVVWLHGGAWRGGLHTEPSEDVDALLDAGIAVARVQYRFSGEVTFPGQLHDVKAALRWLRHYAEQLGIDGRRVGVFGQSSGAHLALLMALTGADPAFDGDEGYVEETPSRLGARVQGAVSWFAPTNLSSMQSQAHPEATDDHDAPDSPESQLLGHPVQDDVENALAASPVSYVHAGAPPILLMHGDDDRIVPVGQARELAAALEAAGAPVELGIVEGADHGFVGIDRGPIVERSVTFLAQALANPGPLPPRVRG